MKKIVIRISAYGLAVKNQAGYDAVTRQWNGNVFKSYDDVFSYE